MGSGYPASYVWRPSPLAARALPVASDASCILTRLPKATFAEGYGRRAATFATVLRRTVTVKEAPAH